MYRFITSKFLIGLKITIRKTISVFLIPNIIEAFCETIPTTSYFWRVDRPQSLPRHIYFCVHEGHKLNFDLLVLTNAMCTIHERLHQKCTRNGAYVVISLFFCNNYHHAKKWHSSWSIIWVNNWKKIPKSC